MIEIIENVYQIRSMVANQYLIIENNEIVLIDTGLKGNAVNIDKSLQEIDLSIKQITKILITHADGDHYGALKRLIELSNATTFTSKLEGEAIAIGQSSRRLDPKGFQKLLFSFVSQLFSNDLVIINKIIKGGDEFKVLGGLEVLSTPGHAPDHLSFYSKTTGILFCGDSIRIDSAKLSPPSGSNTWDLILAKKSFDLQLSLKPKFVCVGHGFVKID